MYHPLWLTGVGPYLSIRNYLVCVPREHDGEELPAELTSTGKLRFADESNIGTGRSGIHDVVVVVVVV